MFIDKINPAALRKDPGQAKRQVEGLFWEMMVNELLKDNTLFQDDLSGKVFGQLFSQALAEKVAASLELGLGERLLSGAEDQPPWPVAGRITSGYGPRIDPINGENRFHHGIDLAAPVGTPIVSINRGQIIFAGELKDYGPTVVVRGEDGSRVIYGHCSRLHVQPGQMVERGQKLAEVGDAGRSTGPHLHLQVEWQGESVNPLHYLQGRLGGIKSYAGGSILSMEEK